MNITALLHEKWVPGASATEIVGRWAEDYNEYIISIPPQLRDPLIALQNAIYDRYMEIVTLGNSLAQQKAALQKILGLTL